MVIVFYRISELEHIFGVLSDLSAVFHQLESLNIKFIKLLKEMINLLFF